MSIFVPGMNRFERVIEREILEEPFPEYSRRIHEERLRRIEVSTPTEIQRMLFFLERDEKRKADEAHERAELRAAFVKIQEESRR